MIRTRFAFRLVAVWGLVAMLSGAAAVAQNKTGGSVSTAYDSTSENREDLLTGPARFEWQRPDRVLRLLSILEGESVADIGAGMGFFSDRLAGAVGPGGTVYAVETDPALVAYLQEKAAQPRYENTVVIHGSETDPKLPEGELDLVLSVNRWHRLGDRGPMLAAVRRALKPGGRFVIIDWHMGEIPIAPPLERRLPTDELIEEMVSDGWTLTTRSRLLKYQYLLIFTR